MAAPSLAPPPSPSSDGRRSLQPRPHPQTTSTTATTMSASESRFTAGCGSGAGDSRPPSSPARTTKKKGLVLSPFPRHQSQQQSTPASPLTPRRKHQQQQHQNNLRNLLGLSPRGEGIEGQQQQSQQQQYKQIKGLVCQEWPPPKNALPMSTTAAAPYHCSVKSTKQRVEVGADNNRVVDNLNLSPRKKMSTSTKPLLLLAGPPLHGDNVGATDNPPQRQKQPALSSPRPSRAGREEKHVGTSSTIENVSSNLNRSGSSTASAPPLRSPSTPLQPKKRSCGRDRASSSGGDRRRYGSGSHSLSPRKLPSKLTFV